MIQETVARLDGMVPDENIYIVTGVRYACLAADQLPQLPRENILEEPFGRNTGPAIGLACAHLFRRDPEAVVAFLHADQSIPQVDKFQAALSSAFTAAAAGHLTTLGIQPTFPHTGFGYIHRTEPLNVKSAGDLPVYAVDRFLEKPDKATAKSFLEQGTYYWNGGMFICQVSHMMKEFERQLPEVYALLSQLTSNNQLDIAKIWDAMPNISIDHGIMEGAKNVAVVPLDAGWNDVGSWDALEAVSLKDENQNCVVNGELLNLNSSGSIVYSNKLVALVGVNDLVIVETDDALLVGQKDQMQQVKSIVEQLELNNKTELL